MIKLKAIILDDEPESINALRLKLEMACPEVLVVETATDPLLILRSIAEKECDILFLDVEMPELNGFGFLKALAHRRFEVIMVTAYSHYAIQAFKANALDYLLKPVDIDELREAVNKVCDRKKTVQQVARKSEKSSETRIQPPPDRIVLPGAREMYFAPVSQIIHIEGVNNYSIFYLTNGEKVVVTKTLGAYEESLRAYGFFRVHKSHLVNLNAIVKLEKGAECVILMSDGTRIEVSTRRKTDFLKTLKEL